MSRIIKGSSTFDDDENSFQSGSDSDESANENIFQQPDFDPEFIRPSIQNQVEEAAFEYERSIKQTHVAQMTSFLDPFYDRCAVCTLPTGTCKHTKAWLAKNSLESSSAQTKVQDDVDMAMDDLTDVLSSDDQLSTLFKGKFDDSRLSFQNMRWLRPVERLSDRIGSKAVNVSRPGALAHHTMVLLGDRFNCHRLVLFGGVKSTEGQMFQPYSSVLNAANIVEYTNDIYIFDLVTSTWFHPDPSGDIPAGRIHHTALALDPDTMFLFGGRGAKGAVFGETFLFYLSSLRWEKVVSDDYDPDLVSSHSPDARFEAAAALRNNQIFLFGGQNIRQNFSDLWIYQIATKTWTLPIITGVPPLPRHGHCMVTLGDGRIFIMGGCQADISNLNGPLDRDQQAVDLLDAASHVSERYRLEDAEVLIGATFLQDSLSSGVLLPGTRGNEPEWRAIARASAELAASVARREKDTNRAEAQLQEMVYSNQLSERWTKSKAVHKDSKLDIVMLMFGEDSLSWVVPRFPAVSGKIPSCRMNFQAMTLAGNKVLVLGGRFPTVGGEPISHVDFDIHLLDSIAMRWSIPLVKNVAQAMQPSVNAAAAAFRRARRALQEAKASTLSQGVLGGNSVRLIEAEAVQLVTQWRLQTLIEEQCQVLSQPDPRIGYTMVNTGRRIYLFGGFDLDGMTAEFLLLDMEQPEEREARMEEEFHVYLEKERQRREEEARQAAMQDDYEARKFKTEELAKEVRERSLMVLEDELSRRPPLTRAPKPQLVAANSHTLWLQWDPVTVNARGQPVHPGDITYKLFMKGGWITLEQGMEVLVSYHPDDTISAEGSAGHLRRILMTRGSVRALLATGTVNSSLQLDMDDALSTGTNRSLNSPHTPNGRRRQFKAVILRCHLDGTFDVKYSDHSKEMKVSRERISPQAGNFAWEVVYCGPDTSYEVQSMVPDINLERESGIRSQATFCIQTIGADFGEGGRSIFSQEVTYSTTGNLKAFESDSSFRKKIKNAQSMDSRLSSTVCVGTGVSKHHL